MQSFQTIGINVLQELSTQGIHYLYTSIDSSSGARTLTKLKMGEKNWENIFRIIPECWTIAYSNLQTMTKISVKFQKNNGLQLLQDLHTQSTYYQKSERALGNLGIKDSQILFPLRGFLRKGFGQ